MNYDLLLSHYQVNDRIFQSREAVVCKPTIAKGGDRHCANTVLAQAELLCAEWAA
jgi:hypothetical protein